jgi:hypothetical protein
MIRSGDAWSASAVHERRLLLGAGHHLETRIKLDYGRGRRARGAAARLNGQKGQKAS